MGWSENGVGVCENAALRQRFSRASMMARRAAFVPALRGVF
jgi:hypothetical protein